jgi:hydrophobe/amphiphile efflux-3 (HAE3) family protein
MHPEKKKTSVYLCLLILAYFTFSIVLNPDIGILALLPPAIVLLICTFCFLKAEKVADAVARHPKQVLIVILLVTATLAPGLSRITFNVNLWSFVPQKYESYQATQKVIDWIGGIDSEILLVCSENLLSPSCVLAVHQLQQELQKDPELSGYLQFPIYSYLRPIERALENFPENEQELAMRLNELYSSNPSVVGQILSQIRDPESMRRLLENFPELEKEASQYIKENQMVGRIVYKVQTFRNTMDALRMSRKLSQKIESFSKSHSIVILIGGTHSTAKSILDTITEERVYLFSIAGVLVLICLILTFRKSRDIILSLLTIGLAILWVLCLMGWFGIEFSPVAVGVFPLLLGLGIDYSIYMNYRYSEERLKGNQPPQASALAILTVGIAIFLSCATTIFGYGSWLTSPMRPLFDFGALSMMGIGFAYILALTFLPSLRRLLDRGVKPGELVEKFSAKKIEEGLARLAHVVEKRPKWILVGAILVTVLCIFSATRARTAVEWEKFAPRSKEIMVGELNSKLWPEEDPLGAAVVAVEGDITDPVVLGSMLEIEMYSLDGKLVTGGISLADFIRQKYGRIPSTREEATNAIDAVLNDYPELEGYLVTKDRKGAVILLFTQTPTEEMMKAAVSKVRNCVQKYGKGAKYYVGGGPAIYSDLLSEIPPSQLKTTTIALFGCFLVLIVVFGSVAQSAICMLPVCLTLVWGFGFFWPLDIPISLLTVLVSAVLIGIGIDYSIHIRCRFVEEFSQTGDIGHSLRETLTRIGGAIFGASTTSLAAMGTLVLSRMPAVAAFGKIVGAEFAACLLAVFFVEPTVIAWYAKRGFGKSKRSLKT